MLEGYKTHLTAALIALVAFAKTMQWMTDEMADTLTGLLIGGGLSFLRVGMKSEVKKVQ